MFPRKFPRENSPAKIPPRKFYYSFYQDAFMHMRTPACIYPQAFFCVYLSTCIFLHVFIHVHFSACIYPRAFSCVYLSTCIFLHVFYPCAFFCVYLSACIFLHVFYPLTYSCLYLMQGQYSTHTYLHLIIRTAQGHAHLFG